MKCWQCNNEASGLCIFCGRAVCKKHVKENPYVLGVYDEEGDCPKVIMVNKALWCGLCEPVPEPVDLPEIEGKE